MAASAAPPNAAHAARPVTPSRLAIRVFVAAQLMASWVCVASSSSSRTAPSNVLFGSYQPTTAPDTFQAMNRWFANGSSPYAQPVQVIDIGWDHVSKVPQQLSEVEAVWTNRAVPMITWMPFPYLTWSSPTPNQDVSDGTYDDYINAFYTGLQTFLSGGDGALGTSDDRRAFLRFAPEPNGNWFPWSPTCPQCQGTGQNIDQTVASYVTMFHYVVDKARIDFNLTTDVLQVVWQVNSVDAWGVSYTMEEFFPGAYYANWVGIGGYNWGDTLPGNTWISAPSMIAPARARLSKVVPPATPLALVTVASTSTPNGTLAKDQWMRGIFDEIVAGADGPLRVKMFAYHNADGQTDTAAFNGTAGAQQWQYQGVAINVYNALRDGVRSNRWFVWTDPMSSRLISDSVFQGSS